MNFLRCTLVFIFFFFVFSRMASATHIVGGEMYYEHLGNNIYAIELWVYRDCYTGVPFFDNPASIGVFNSNNSLLFERCLSLIAFGTIPPTIVSPCFIPPTDVCYQWAVYRDTISLPPILGGYQLSYQRCCRNQSILNIVTPLAVGITIYAQTPSNPVYANNSNPVFDTLPPPFICLNVPFSWNYSATDKENDSLVYELCVPFVGGVDFNDCPPGFPQCGTGTTQWTCGPQPMPPNNPPYSTVTWQAPFSLSNLLGGVAMSVNSATGLLTCTPNTIGQFVYGVCVREYRNGILIGRTRRDFQVNVVPCPSLVVAALQNPIINCNSTTVTFQNQSIGASTYFWNFGDPTSNADTSVALNPTYTYPDTGVYNVTLIAYSTLNGCADSTTGEVHLFPPFNADFNFTLNPCNLVVGFTSTSQNTGSGLASSWQWNFGDNSTSNLQNPVHTFPSGGTYNVTLTVQSDSGCTDVIQKTVIITEPVNATISVTQPVSCNSDCNASATLIVTSGIPPFSYQWNDPNNQTTLTASGLCAGTYSVLITDSNNCAVTKTIVINEPAPLTIATTSTDAYCGGRCYGTATGLPVGGTPPVTYTWSDPQNQSTPTATGLCPGVYGVIITDSHGCTFIDSVDVLYSSYIPPLDAIVSDGTIYEGQTVQITSTVYATGTYTWTPPTGLSSTSISNPTATPPVSSITYFVEYVDSNGCDNRDSVNIVVKEVLCIEPELFIPNAFTPNDDGKNDLLYVRGNTIKELLLRVYNRWGEKVFETTTPNTGWDGKFKNEFVMAGVYDYYLDATCFNNEKFFKKGNVTVIR